MKGEAMKFLQIMRPLHWTKNVFVFAGLIFGKKLIGPIDEVFAAVGSTVGGFFCFSLAASAIYIFNDIIDRETDMLHPEKSKSRKMLNLHWCCNGLYEFTPLV